MSKTLLCCAAVFAKAIRVDSAPAEVVVVPAGHGVSEDIEITQLAIGDSSPQCELFGVDFRYHSLEMYEGRKAVVVAFVCNHCPVAVSYEDTFVELANKYQKKGAQFLPINPNPADKVAADSFPRMIERAKERVSLPLSVRRNAEDRPRVRPREDAARVRVRPGEEPGV